MPVPCPSCGVDNPINRASCLHCFAPLPAVVEDIRPCPVHRGARRAGVCKTCGRVVCVECGRIIGGKMICDECALK